VAVWQMGLRKVRLLWWCEFAGLGLKKCLEGSLRGQASFVVMGVKSAIVFTEALNTLNGNLFWSLNGRARCLSVDKYFEADRANMRSGTVSGYRSAMAGRLSCTVEYVGAAPITTIPTSMMQLTALNMYGEPIALN